MSFLAKQSSIDYVWTNESETLELCFSVSYTWERGQKATWDDPGYPDGPVDVSFDLQSIRTIPGYHKTPRSFDRSKLSARWIAQAERDMQASYDRDSDEVDSAIDQEENDRRNDYRW